MHGLARRLRAPPGRKAIWQASRYTKCCPARPPKGGVMKLFEPLDIGGTLIQNRIMVPAMVTRLSGEDGFVNQDITNRYVRYAQGSAGLIVIEAMAVHHARDGPLLRIRDDRFIPGLAGLAQCIHDTSDSKVVPQIIHFMKVSKSGWRQTIDMLSLAEIDWIVEEFGQ